jgi:hypothetical protein
MKTVGLVLKLVCFNWVKTEFCRINNFLSIHGAARGFIIINSPSKSQNFLSLN